MSILVVIINFPHPRDLECALWNLFVVKSLIKLILELHLNSHYPNIKFCRLLLSRTS